MCERESARARERERESERERERARERESRRERERELCTSTPNYITTSFTTCLTTCFTTHFRTCLRPRAARQRVRAGMPCTLTPPPTPTRSPCSPPYPVPPLQQDTTPPFRPPDLRECRGCLFARDLVCRSPVCVYVFVSKETHKCQKRPKSRPDRCLALCIDHICVGVVGGGGG